MIKPAKWRSLFSIDELRSFYEGLAAFKLNGKCGYLDTAGTIVIPAQYQTGGGFSKGCAGVYDGSRAFLIDRKGNAVPGSDKLDPDSYFIELDDGAVTTVAPDEYVVIRENGKYGYGKISYLPPLPDRSEMSSWAYEEVVAAIEEELVPAALQNLYLNNITREEFSALVVEALCQVLDTQRDDLVLEKTGKKMSAWTGGYPFHDTANSNIIAAYALDIVNGYGDGTFNPYASITRQEAAALLMRAAKVLGMDTANPDGTNFADGGQVASWFKEAVDFVCQIGVMNGTGNDSFTPLGSYTREQSFMTIYRLFLAVNEQEQ